MQYIIYGLYSNGTTEKNGLETQLSRGLNSVQNYTVDHIIGKCRIFDSRQACRSHNSKYSTFFATKWSIFPSAFTWRVPFLVAATDCIYIVEPGGHVSSCSFEKREGGMINYSALTVCAHKDCRKHTYVVTLIAPSHSHESCALMTALTKWHSTRRVKTLLLLKGSVGTIANSRDMVGRLSLSFTRRCVHVFG